MASYKRFEGEKEKAYIYRICSMKDRIGSWDDVAAILNKELDHNYSSSAYRKRFQYTQTTNSDREDILSDNQKIIEEIKEERRALARETIALRDERSALSRIVREEARLDELVKIIERGVNKYSPRDTWNDIFYADSDTNMIVHATDMHAGIEINNSFNVYNSDTMFNRLEYFFSRIDDARKRHRTKDCHLILGGDQISGIIHASLRIENKENIVEQIMTVSEALSNFVARLGDQFENVYVYSVSGNHSRIFMNKAEAVKGENLDALIPFYMNAALSNYKNVKFVNNTIDESIGSFTVNGQLVYFVHGDKDNVNNIVQRLTMVTGKKPNLIYMGHRHLNGLTTVYDTKVIESGCLSGTDNYCIDNRLRNRPEQTISIINDDGLVCLYDIKF